MNVLHVIPSVARRYGGPSSAIVPMCHSLLNRQLRACIATTDADGPGRLSVPLGQETTWDGVPAIFFRRDCSEAYKYSHGLGRWLSRHVADFDIVHIHAVLSYAPIAAAAACRRAGVPYVVRPLGTIDPWSLGQKSLKKKLFLTMSGRRMLNGAAAIHYTSSEEKRLAERTMGLSRGVVIPLGIDEELLAQPLASADERRRDPYVLVLSRLHPVKNLEPLITAFANITGGQSAGTGWRLVIAGTGEPSYVARLQLLAEREGAGTRVAFLGWTDGDAKQRLIRNASLYALPSMHENFGMSLVEAFAAGVPALVSHDVHLAENIRAVGAGWVVHTDEASVRAGLLEALRSADERDARGRAARLLARTFAWPGIGAELHHLYQRLIPASSDTGRTSISKETEIAGLHVQ